MLLDYEHSCMLLMLFIRWHVELIYLHWDQEIERGNILLLHITVECTLLTLSKTCPIYLDDADAFVAVVVLSRD